MKQQLTPKQLYRENLGFAGIGGVSPMNRSRGFLPAFCDTESGSVRLSRFRDGSPAPLHLLDGLPNEWVSERNPLGQVIMVKDSVVAGFVHRGRFYTREQAATAYG